MLGHSYLRNLAFRSAQHPFLSLAGALLLSITSIWYTATNLTFMTSRNDLVSRDQPYVRLASEYEEEFKGLDEFIVVISARHPRRARQFADELASQLQSSPDLIEEVFYRVDRNILEGKQLLLLGSDDLTGLAENLEEHEDLLEELFESPSLYSILSFVNRKMKEAVVKTGSIPGAIMLPRLPPSPTTADRTEPGATIGSGLIPSRRFRKRQWGFLA